MSIRIYTFAKQLKTEAKTLLDICTKIGISGKGSPLASLSDEEAAAIKAHLEHRAKPSRGPVIGGAGAAGAGLDRGAGGGATVVRREDYVPPTGAMARKVPVLGKKPDKVAPPKKPPTEAETPSKPSEKDKAAPAIKLAPIPVAQQPTAAPRPAEPAPQKPELRLPAYVIRASKAGASRFPNTSAARRSCVIRLRLPPRHRQPNARGPRKGRRPRSRRARNAKRSGPTAARDRWWWRARKRPGRRWAAANTVN